MANANDRRAPLGPHGKEKTGCPKIQNKFTSSLRVPDDTSWPKIPDRKLRENIISNGSRIAHVALAAKSQKNVIKIAPSPFKTTRNKSASEECCNKEANSTIVLNPNANEPNALTDIKSKSLILNPTASADDSLKNDDKLKDQEISIEKLENDFDAGDNNKKEAENPVLRSAESNSSIITTSQASNIDSSTQERTKIEKIPNVSYRSSELNNEERYINLTENIPGQSKTRKPRPTRTIVPAETTDSETPYSSDPIRTKILLDNKRGRALDQPSRKSCLRLSKSKKDSLETCSCSCYEKSKIARRSDPQLSKRAGKCCGASHLHCCDSHRLIASESDCRIGLLEECCHFVAHKNLPELKPLFNKPKDKKILVPVVVKDKDALLLKNQISMGAPPGNKRKSDREDVVDNKEQQPPERLHGGADYPARELVMVGKDATATSESATSEKKQVEEEVTISTTQQQQQQQPRPQEATSTTVTTAATTHHASNSEVKKKASLTVSSSGVKCNSSNSSSNNNNINKSNLVTGKKQAVDNRLLKLKITVFLSFVIYSFMLAGPLLYDYFFYEEESDAYEDMSYIDIMADYIFSSFQEAFGGLFEFISKMFFQSRTCKKCNVNNL